MPSGVVVFDFGWHVRILITIKLQVVDIDSTKLVTDLASKKETASGATDEVSIILYTLRQANASIFHFLIATLESDFPNPFAVLPNIIAPWGGSNQSSFLTTWFIPSGIQ